MTQTHTAAPWKIENDSCGSITITHESQELRSHICVLPRMTLCEEHGTMAANAALIAAAPELLEALQAIASGEVMKTDTYTYADVVLAYQEKARAAIAKATGAAS